MEPPRQGPQLVKLHACQTWCGCRVIGVSEEYPDSKSSTWGTEGSLGNSGSNSPDPRPDVPVDSRFDLKDVGP